MSQSVLLAVARSSIEEVLKAENSINRADLVSKYPILDETIQTEIAIFIDNKLRGVASDRDSERSLLESIIHNAKCAAFLDEDYEPLTTTEYLHSTIKLTIYSSDGELSHQSEPIIHNV